MKFSRTRLLALLLVAVFSFGAVGYTAIASASDATVAKKKKCKKGYKKVGKKCKKKKAAKPKASDIVASVKLTSIDPSIYGSELLGTLTLKKPVTSIEFTVFRQRGVLPIRSAKSTLTSDGVATTINFKVRAPNAPPSERSRAPISYWVSVDGVKSNTLP